MKRKLFFNKCVAAILMFIIVIGGLSESVLARENVNSDIYYDSNNKLELVYEGALLTKVYQKGQLVLTNEYVERIRTKKIGEDICEFVYNDDRQIVSEVRYSEFTEINIIYQYEENERISALVGFLYNNEKYKYTFDDMNRINGIKDEKDVLIAMYEYAADTDVVVSVKKQVEDNWIIETSDSFIGNINRLRYRGMYYDVETELYYGNGVFYNPSTREEVSNVYLNTGIMLLTYGEDLDDEICSMRDEYLADPNFNDALPRTSNWYQGCSDVEIVARVIYGESAAVLPDQDAVAGVIRNRATSLNQTPRNVVVADGQFSAATRGGDGDEKYQQH